MQTRAAAALYDYWTRRRGSRPVPLRSEIEPADLAAVLPDLFILEAGGAGPPRFRLAGTRICAQFGRELKASRFDMLFAADERDRVLRLCGTVLAHRTPTILSASALSGAREATLVEIVLLPLATAGRLADRIIGAFAPLPGQRPPLAAFGEATLACVATIDADRLPGRRPAIALPTSVVAVRAGDFGRAVGRVLHLRVFEGGKGKD